MPKYKTPHEAFWAGEFGDSYCERNRGERLRANNRVFWAQILRRIPETMQSVLELGANIGMNLRAISELVPGVSMTGVEINETASRELRQWGGVEVVEESILNFTDSRKWDLVFTKGVLIHIDPESLGQAYDLMYSASARYMLMAEYYNPSPAQVTYRGNNDRLYKRDFAGEFLDRYPDVKIVDYGFVWHREAFPQDDITWFLMRK